MRSLYEPAATWILKVPSASLMLPRLSAPSEASKTRTLDRPSARPDSASTTLPWIVADRAAGVPAIAGADEKAIEEASKAAISGRNRPCLRRRQGGALPRVDAKLTADQVDTVADYLAANFTRKAGDAG